MSSDQTESNKIKNISMYEDKYILTYQYPKI